MGESYNLRMTADGIVPAIRARLGPALAPPQGSYVRWMADATTAGWLDAGRAARVAACNDVFEIAGRELAIARSLADCLARTTALERVARALAGEGRLSAWRDERYSVTAAFGDDPLLDIERAAARYFGVHTYAVHVNGLVANAGGRSMWLARRSPAKAIDPGLLDNLVGGGIATGYGVRDTLVKEAWEEAGIPAALAASARDAGSLDICRPQPQGLQRETIFVYDLALDGDFVPANRDGEAVEHRLVSFDEAARLIAIDAGDDALTADASLVALDCLLRHDAIAADGLDRAALSAFRRAALEPRLGSDGLGRW